MCRPLAASWLRWGALVLCGLVTPVHGQTAEPAAADAPQLGTRLELFVDHALLDRLEGTQLKLHHPQPAETALVLDRPWEGAFCGYFTILVDDKAQPAAGGNTGAAPSGSARTPRYRLYYRGLPTVKSREVTCYAESDDGIHFTRPNLGLYEVEGGRDNNVILADHPAAHNFAPFLDRRPGVPDDARFKALGGDQRGLLVFVSGDGIHWRPLRTDPVITEGAFDSQNVGFWSEAEGCYLCYFRAFDHYRTIHRTTSPDLVSWSRPEAMSYGDTPREHLYTNQTHPYFRAPHLYISLPMRFLPGRRVISEADADALEVVRDYRNDCSEGVLMTSRGGNRYVRTFMEAFQRPGRDPGNWVSRVNMAALGVVPTGADEMSVYYSQHYAQPSHHLRRFTLRTDGFISINAPYAGGEFVTRPFRFTGDRLVLNFATAAVGSLRVELQSAAGEPLEGYTLADSPDLVGDKIAAVVEWRQKRDVSALQDRPIRLRCAMKDADLFSFRFAPAEATAK